MAPYTSALCYFLVFVVFSVVKIEARESKFFSKAVVINTVKNVTQHVDPASPSPSSSSPSPAPVKAEMNSGYGLYGRDTLFEKNIPTQDKFGKEDEFDNDGLASNYNDKLDKQEFGLPSNYNERSYVKDGLANERSYVSEDFGLPSNYNEHSYVTVPRKSVLKEEEEEFSNNNNGSPHENKFTSTSTNEVDDKLTPEEEKLFNENANNDTPKFAEMDKYFNDNVKEPQGMSGDTNTLENGDYQYAFNVDATQRAYVNPTAYNTQGYYAKHAHPAHSNYEFDTMEQYEKQQGYSQIPGDYINP